MTSLCVLVHVDSDYKLKLASAAFLSVCIDRKGNT